MFTRSLYRLSAVHSEAVTHCTRKQFAMMEMEVVMIWSGHEREKVEMERRRESGCTHVDVFCCRLYIHIQAGQTLKFSFYYT